MLASLLGLSYARVVSKLTRPYAVWDRLGFKTWQRLSGRAWRMDQRQVCGEIHELVEDELFTGVGSPLDRGRDCILACQALRWTNGSYYKKAAKVHFLLSGWVDIQPRKRAGRLVDSVEDRVLFVLTGSARGFLWHRTVRPFFRMVNGMIDVMGIMTNEED